jgi:acetyl-CoA acetyltransferase
MRLNATIAGVGMTRFMKYPDKGLKELGGEAARAAVADAGLELGCRPPTWATAPPAW